MPEIIDIIAMRAARVAMREGFKILCPYGRIGSTPIEAIAELKLSEHINSAGRRAAQGAALFVVAILACGCASRAEVRSIFLIKHFSDGSERIESVKADRIEVVRKTIYAD